MNEQPTIKWTEAGQEYSAPWHSENGAPPPKRVVVADDRMAADTAYRLACEGTALLWRGDYHNGRQLLQAMARRVNRKPPKSGQSVAETFHLHRMAQSQHARILGMLLLQFEDDYSINLRRAPDVREAITEAYGPGQGGFVASLRELLGLIGAHEWHKKGIMIPSLGDRIYPCYGVFSPVRGEYLDLLLEAPLPARSLAFDIGTGTGVVAAVLARRGVERIIATDLDPRALTCARENIKRLGMSGQVQVIQADLFPEGRAPLIVCNPPWVPARPSSPIEQAVYDLDSRMLRGFLQGLTEHLEPNGEGWLILSDIAEHLGLRTRATLTEMIESAGLKVLGKLDIRPRHPKAADPNDPLHAARSAEVTSLWRLAVR